MNRIKQLSLSSKLNHLVTVNLIIGHTSKSPDVRVKKTKHEEVQQVLSGNNLLTASADPTRQRAFWKARTAERLVKEIKRSIHINVYAPSIQKATTSWNGRDIVF